MNLAMTHPNSCQTDTAVVSWFEEGTDADSAANQLVARFCSASPSAATASFIFDQPGGSKGKFKVVALDPTDPDSARVLESNEVTYNGGVVGEYPPVVLRATAVHNSAMLEVVITGARLSSTSLVELCAPDGLWSLPLAVGTATSNRLNASAYVPTPLGAATIKLGNQGDQVAVGAFPGDGVEPDVPETTEPIYLYDPAPTAFYPKDLSLFYNQVPTGDPQNPWQGLFHVMYIRTDKVTRIGTYLTHAWSDDNMQTWNWHIKAFEPSSNAWDKHAVWAPSLIQLGPTTCMFYTGEADILDPDQSIGYATTSLLHDSAGTVWERQTNPAFVVTDASSWALPNGIIVDGATQFRDPFVMRNPANRDELLLFNVGEDKVFPGKMTVGVAHNDEGSLNSWTSIGHYPAIDFEHLYATRQAESPMAMQDPTGTLPWRLIVARGDYGGILPEGSASTYLLRQAPGYALTDTALAAWPSAVTLYDYLGQEPYLLGWQASEHLKVGNLNLFAGFDGDRILISQTYWSANEFVLSHPQFTGAPTRAEGISPRFGIAEWAPGSGRVRLRLDGVSVSAPRVEIYDVLGRRVRVLAEGNEVRGPQEYTWACDREDGSSVRSGMYFARMTGVGEQQVLRVAVAR